MPEKMGNYSGLCPAPLIADDRMARGLLFADPDAGTLAPDDERALIDVVMQTLDAALD